jgi:hypothetical protein
MLLFPKTVANGAAIGLLLMTGALGSHVTELGFEGEMGSLALMALVTWGCCLAVAVRFRDRFFCMVCWTLGKCGVKRPEDSV